MLKAIFLIFALLQPSHGQFYSQNNLNPFSKTSFRQFIQDLYDQNQHFFSDDNTQSEYNNHGSGGTRSINHHGSLSQPLQPYPQNDLNPSFGNTSFRQFIQNLYDQNQRQHKEVMAKIENLEQVSRERDMVIKKLETKIKELDEVDQGE